MGHSKKPNGDVKRKSIALLKFMELTKEEKNEVKEIVTDYVFDPDPRINARK